MIYAFAATALAAALLASAGAWKVQDWRYAARDAERLEAAQETQRLRARTADTASAGFEGDRVRIKTEFQTIYSEVARVIEKPVYRNVCLDADGLRLLGNAARGQPSASEPAPAVPRPGRAF